MIEFIKTCIYKAENYQSKLTEEVFKIKGFTSRKIQCLLNNLGSKESLNHLEIGLNQGATYIATNFNNNLNSSVGIDNWCKYNSRQLFWNNFYIHQLPKYNTSIIEEDSFKLDLIKIKDKVDFYFYDGSHSVIDQYLALSYFYPVLDDSFIFIVDDWSRESVQTGTMKGIKDCNLKVCFQTELYDDWHEGLVIFYLNK